MHLRTFVPIIVLVSFALIIAGCGNPPEEATEQPAQETTEQPAQETAAEATGEPEIPAAEESAPEIVAYVNERPLYREGLERELELVKSQYAQIYAQFGQDLRALLAGAAGRELELNLELEALNRLAGRELLFEEAEARGIEVTDARVDEKFAELYVEFLASRGMTEEEFEEYVQGVGSSMEEFLTSSKRSVREQLIIEALQNDVVGPVELSEDEVARLSVNQYRLPGIQIKAELLRHYPIGELMAHVAGYVGRISERDLRRLDTKKYSASSHIGKVGIEKFYEDILHGDIGHQRVETNAQGRIIKVLERTLPTPGKTLYLNVDSNLQATAYKAFGENNGALMAMDPTTGAVLAMVSAPAYDPNIFVQGIEAEDFQKISKSPRRPLFNRALQGQYPPGSTIKPLLGLAGLELDEVYAHNPIDCKGWYMLEDDVDERRYRDWKRSGHGATSLISAIAESCDIYFYDLSYNLGIDRIHQYLSAFGMGKKAGIDMEGEFRGIVPNKEWKRRNYNEMWFPGETLINGIGQGFMLATPIQLASFTAALTQAGKRFKPNILKATQDPKTKVLTQVEPTALQSVHQIKLKNWETVLHAMRQVVHGRKGSARGISYGIKYTMAGKTGTSQVFGIKEGERYEQDKLSKKLHDHALFVGFAPYKNPTIAVSAIVENGGGGGTVAAPVVRKVIDTFLLGISDEAKPTE